jgi:serine/threonine protein kinase
VHEFVEGQPLHRDVRVPDEFFGRLESALAQIHAREMAYVDLEKPQNVLLGDDGRPYLIDFQISWRLRPSRGGRTAIARWICSRLQQGDRYHLLKLRRRFRPDQLTPEQIEASYRRPAGVRLHARLTRPLLRLRRRLLDRLEPSRRVGERGTVSR